MNTSDVTSAFDQIFNPKSIAIVGLSRSETTFSNRLFQRLRASSSAASVFPITPRTKEIDGCAAYPSLNDVEEPIEVALIMRPVPEVIPCLRECVESEVGSVILYNSVSAGFENFNEEVRQVIAGSGTRVLGPNSMGSYNLAGDVPLTYSFPSGNPPLHPGLGVAVVGHSGGVVQGIAAHVMDLGASVSHFVSLGNEADIQVEDAMEYLINLRDVAVIVAYLEQIRSKDRFVEVAQAGRDLGKEIVLLRVGHSKTAKAIAYSHTGAIVGTLEHEASIMQEIGVHWTESTREAGVIAASVRAKSATSGGLGVVTTSGGLSALIADEAERLNVSLPELDGRVTAAIRMRLEPTGLVDPNVINPVDLGASPHEDPSIWQDTIEMILHQTSVAGCLVVTFGARVKWAAPAVEAGIKEGKPVGFLLFMRDVEEFQDLAARGVPVYADESESIVGLSAILRSAHQLKLPSLTLRRSGCDDPSLGNRFGNSHPPEKEVKTWLNSEGIRTPAGFVATSLDGVMDLASTLRTPLVLKVSDYRISHKTDFGGVVVGINDVEDLPHEYDSMVRHLSEVGIEAPEGFLLEEQVDFSGIEWMIGVRNDLEMGPLVTIGPGGLLVESMDDFSSVPAPFGEERASSMLRSLRSWRALTKRGQLPKNSEVSLSRLLVAVSRLCWRERSWIAEMDLNPVVVYEGEAVALDARLATRSTIESRA